MPTIYIIVEKCKRPHPFKNEKGGRWWFQGFKSRHPNLTARMPQSLAYCQALSANKENISDFWYAGSYLWQIECNIQANANI